MKKSEKQKKYKEIILYIIFGACTTVINFAVFWLLNKFVGENYYLLNNIAAWIVAVAFAFVTNKLLVFGSKSGAKATVLREAFEFFLARLFSLAVEELGLLAFVELLKFKYISLEIFGFGISGRTIAKVILAVVVVILNYVFSKFIVFAKKNKSGENKE